MRPTRCRRAGARSIIRPRAAPTCRWSYSAIQVGGEGRIVAVGRDLRSISALQQRLVEAQQSMERDYWRLRHVETRYRLLFQMATEAVLIVDATTQKVLEANPAAVSLLGATERRMVGKSLLEGFDAPSAAAIDELLAGVRIAGRADEVRARAGREPSRVPRVGVAVPAGKRVALPGALRAAADGGGDRRRGQGQVEPARAGGGERARRLRRHRGRRPHPRRAIARSSTWRSSRPRSRRAANRSSAGSAGPAST